MFYIERDTVLSFVVELIGPALMGRCNVRKACIDAKAKRVVLCHLLVLLWWAQTGEEPMDESYWSDEEFCKANEGTIQ